MSLGFFIFALITIGFFGFAAGSDWSDRVSKKDARKNERL